jgi:hypothetical protein
MSEMIDMEAIRDLKSKQRDEAGAARGNLILANFSQESVIDILRAFTHQAYDDPEFRELLRSVVWIGDKKDERRKQHYEKKCD